jgi:hypothetical protein
VATGPVPEVGGQVPEIGGQAPEEDAMKVDDDDSGAGNAWSLNDMKDCLEEETSDTQNNLWNPNGYGDNCVFMGLSHVTGSPLDKIEESIGRPVNPANWALNDERVPRVVADHNLQISDDIPPECYFEEGGRAAVWYHAARGGHVVEIEHGSDERNMTYRDYQGHANGQDVTDEVRRDGHRRYIHGYVENQD